MVSTAVQTHIDNKKRNFLQKYKDAVQEGLDTINPKFDAAIYEQDYLGPFNGPDFNRLTQTKEALNNTITSAITTEFHSNMEDTSSVLNQELLAATTIADVDNIFGKYENAYNPVLNKVKDYLKTTEVNHFNGPYLENMALATIGQADANFQTAITPAPPPAAGSPSAGGTPPTPTPPTGGTPVSTVAATTGLPIAISDAIAKIEAEISKLSGDDRVKAEEAFKLLHEDADNAQDRIATFFAEHSDVDVRDEFTDEIENRNGLISDALLPYLNKIRDSEDLQLADFKAVKGIVENQNAALFRCDVFKQGPTRRLPSSAAEIIDTARPIIGDDAAVGADVSMGVLGTTFNAVKGNAFKAWDMMTDRNNGTGHTVLAGGGAILSGILTFKLVEGIMNKMIPIPYVGPLIAGIAGFAAAVTVGFAVFGMIQGGLKNKAGQFLPDNLPGNDNSQSVGLLKIQGHRPDLPKTFVLATDPNDKHAWDEIRAVETSTGKFAIQAKFDNGSTRFAHKRVFDAPAMDPRVPANKGDDVTIDNTPFEAENIGFGRIVQSTLTEHTPGADDMVIEVAGKGKFAIDLQHEDVPALAN